MSRCKCGYEGDLREVDDHITYLAFWGIDDVSINEEPMHYVVQA
jgi:hypothetical protein